MAQNQTIVRTASLSPDRIVGSLDDDYITCPICCNVLWKPIACKTCENAFCMKCIRLWLKDNPKKCPFQCHFKERKPSPILLKILSKLQVACRHKVNGCSAMCLYEALERHEQQECGYRLIQCALCSKEMLQKDVESHGEEECPSKEVTCLKCGSTYFRRDGHTKEYCLQVQIRTLEEKLRDREEQPKMVVENYSTMTDMYNRSTSISFSLSSDNVITSDPLAGGELEPTATGSLRISDIHFSRLPDSEPCGGSISNGYAGFNWENAYYTTPDYVSTNFHLGGFRKAFHLGQQHVAYNSRGAPLSLSLPNPEQSFGLHSFEAMSVYHGELKMFIIAYRSNVVIDTKYVTLSRNELKLFEMDWEGIDRVVFQPELRPNTLRPSTFALSSLNLVL